MEKIRILIGNNKPSQGMMWANRLMSLGHHVVTRENCGTKLLQYLDDYFCDIIVVEAKMEDMSVYSFTRAVIEKNPTAIPVILVIADTVSDHFDMKESLNRLGISCDVVVQPLTVENIVSRILRLVAGPPIQIHGNMPVDSTDLELTVTDILSQIGVPSHIKGYGYLRYIIMEGIKDPTILVSATKSVYPAVAKKFNTTPSRSERAIRHAIEKAFDQGDMALLDPWFGYSISSHKGKPTNFQFIHTVCDRIRIQIKSKSTSVSV